MRQCSECSHARVTLNPKAFHLEGSDLNSPACVESVRCRQGVWPAVTSLALLVPLEANAVLCPFYERQES
jgi:hypothetical protein